jgi:hypothetical protein
MGLIPIHVYSDVPWVPYIDTLREVGFVVHIRELHGLLSTLLSLSDEEVLTREKRALQFSQTHFTFASAMHHISKFLLNDESGSELRCQTLPPSVRGDYLEEGCEHLLGPKPLLA